MSIILASIVDAAIALTLAVLATILIKRQSAASRHAILTMGIVTALLMPAFELLLPQFPVIAFGSSTASLSTLSTFGGTVVSRSFAEGASVAARPASWWELVVVVWALGSLVTFAGLLTGLVRLRRLRTRCSPIVGGPWRELADAVCAERGIRRHVHLLQSAGQPVLITCGVWSPAIILPATAMQWPDARKRIVLRHELAHVQRHDAAIQLLGEALRIVQWPNPLVWLACRRLRQESEYACDDAVLSAGVESTDYATQLLEVARHLAGRDCGWAAAPAIAHRSTLERRIVAMLHGQRNHAPLSRRGWSMAALVALAVSIPVAGAAIGSTDRNSDGIAPATDVILQAQAPLVSPDSAPAIPVSRSRVVIAAERRPAARLQQGPATFAGTIIDQSGGVMPGVEVTITDAKTGSQQATRTDAKGGFVFRDIPASEYGVSAALPGFATFKTTLTLEPGAAIQQTVTLPLGSLRETLIVKCVAAPVGDSSMLASRREWPGLIASSARIVRVGVTGISRELLTVVSAQEQVPVKVGGNVRAPRKIYDLKPACPPGLPAGNTVVKVTARIDTEGLVQDLSAGQTPPEVPGDAVNAALDAVRRWKFTPTLLNGQPTEVSITVQVTFVRQ